MKNFDYYAGFEEAERKRNEQDLKTMIAALVCTAIIAMCCAPRTNTVTDYAVRYSESVVQSL